jgi:hypothetical protein
VSVRPEAATTAGEEDVDMAAPGEVVGATDTSELHADLPVVGDVTAAA